MMSATAEDEVVQAPPQPPSPIPDEPFFAPAVVHGIDANPPPTSPSAPAHDGVTDRFSTLTSRVAGAAREVRSAVASVALPSLSGLSAAQVALPAIVLFGDSITEYGGAVRGDAGLGWGLRLQSDYNGRVDVYVRGYSGYNSRWARYMLPSILDGLPTARTLRAVVIFFGANDATVKGEKQHVPLEEYKENVTKLAEYVRRGGGRVVPVLVTPPPVQETRDGDSPRRLAARTAEYARAVVMLGTGMDVPVVDLHSEMVRQVGGAENQAELDRYLCDGLHLNEEGNRLVAKMVIEALRGVDGVVLEEVRRPYPEWGEINPERPGDDLGSSPLVREGRRW